MSRRTFLSIGSNMGERREHLATAVDSLPDVVGVSGVYVTDAVGGPMQSAFLNLVVQLETDIEPDALLGVCQRIESAANRVRTERWGPRTLDVDIIWMDGVTLDTERLTLPHPRWKQRRFVLTPLRELAPDLVTTQDIDLADGRVWPVEPLA